MDALQAHMQFGNCTHSSVLLVAQLNVPGGVVEQWGGGPVGVGPPGEVR